MDGNMCGGWIHQTGAMQKSSSAADLICDAVTICCINHIFFPLYFSRRRKMASATFFEEGSLGIW